MSFQEFGNLSISSLTLTPNYIEQGDYSYMVFDVSIYAKLIVSCVSNTVLLRCTRDDFTEEFWGTVTPEEQEILRQIYFKENA